jgi:hypothetical protein
LVNTPDLNDTVFTKTIPTNINFNCLSWLDLSFNSIVTIDASIKSLKSLQIVYLHGNAIEKLSELEKLSGLTNLKSLTAHGNPCQNNKTYRTFLIQRIPSLKKLDFSLISKQERHETFYLKVKDQKHRSQ